MSEAAVRLERPGSDKMTLQAFEAFLERQPDGRKYELIDGAVYQMAAPTVIHTLIASFISGEFYLFLRDKTCKLLQEQSVIPEQKEYGQNYFVPDIMVVCDKRKIYKKGIYGAPDLIVEIVSPSTSKNDYLEKYYAYMRLGVREYWIVDYDHNMITCYINGDPRPALKSFTFQDKVPAHIFPGLEVDFNNLQIEEYPEEP